MNLQPLLQPKTMAIVGVSANNDKHPANVIYSKNHLRLPVTVYPVNPSGGSLHGQRLFQKISDIPKKVERIVYESLEKDPRNRYGDIRETKKRKLHELVPYIMNG